MNKLKLQIDNLRVETFETAETSDLRGTVAANMPKPTRPEPCLQDTNITGACCEYTFALSCVQTNCLECNVVTADTCAV
ncbi:MAG TPA: hypothetical protein VGB15_03920 [Longimicrobium sp.]|jgi:hypothetical protein